MCQIGDRDLEAVGPADCDHGKIRLIKLSEDSDTGVAAVTTSDGERDLLKVQTRSGVVAGAGRWSSPQKPGKLGFGGGCGLASGVV